MASIRVSILPLAICILLLVSAPSSDSKPLNAGETAEEVTDFLVKAFNALKSLSDALGKSGYNLEKFAVVINAVGPALGVMGPLFSLASALIPQGPSPELQAIESGFKQVNLRFDDVDRKLDDILLGIEKAVVYESYKENQDRLQQVFLKYEQFKRVPGTPSSEELIEACARNDPDVTLDWIYRNCVQDQVGAELLDTIFKDVKYDRKLLLQFFQIILRDFTQSTVMRQVCLGMRFPNATDIMEDNRKQDEQKLQAIHAKLLRVEKDLVENFYRTQLAQDMTMQLEAHQEMSHQDFAKTLRDHLQEKYYWVLWGAQVYNPIEGFEVHAVHCVNTSKVGCQFVWRQFNRNVVASWGDLDTTEAAKAIEQFHARNDTVACERNAEKLNDDLWKWDGIKDRKMVLVVEDKAKLVSVHGGNEAEETMSCKHLEIFGTRYNIVLQF